MKLTYRGVGYEYNPMSTDVINTPAVGKYRGSPYKFHRVIQNSVMPSVLYPIYRGAVSEVAC